MRFNGMTSQELRIKFLKFFESKGHTIIPSASLVPREENQSVLFTTAGMHPLVPYFFGKNHLGGKRIANSQKCIRTADIDDVGDNRHLTFFEMMGNWSFGDYFKKEAIEWSFEFLTGKEWLNMDPKRIYVTVFRGEDGIPCDDEAIEIWKNVFSKIGMNIRVAGKDEIMKNDIRIIPLGVDDNFWIAGETGPCGPDTEIFYDTRPEEGILEGNFSDFVKNFRLIEIWNNVFMEYEKKLKIKNAKLKIEEAKEYEYIKLKQRNVDTGMGLERTVAVLNGKETVFETDIFEPIFDAISKVCGKKYNENPEIKKAFRIIADHIKASAFIICDGVMPSNIGRGYVLRRLIRRAVRYSRTLELELNFKLIIDAIIDIYKVQYPELDLKSPEIIKAIRQEVDKFNKTLERGLKEFERTVSAVFGDTTMREEKDAREMAYDALKKISGKIAFDLYQTYGFPIEMIKELAREYGLAVDEIEFNIELEKHQEVSRKGAEVKFGGHGMEVESLKSKVENFEEIEKKKKLHTATHLLHQALRIILGVTVGQMGSDINSERLRFDFTFDRKMTPEEIKLVEELINEQIRKNLNVKYEEMLFEKAVHLGALAFFKEKYPDRVKVYSVGGFSKEVCGGPHVENTSEMGEFKIQKEESSSAGVRRIKAILR